MPNADHDDGDDIPAQTADVSPSGHEDLKWSGSSSQATNLGTYIVCTLLCWLIIPIFIGLYKYLQVRCTRFELTSQRLKISTGILAKTHDEIELYRIKDYSYSQSIFERIFKLGTIELVTSDHSHPTVNIDSIKDAARVKDLIRELVEDLRSRKGVREID